MEPVTFTVDGNALYGEYHAPSGKALGAVLVVHGFNSCLREFGTYPARLAQTGFHVLAFDQRGFGASGGEPGRVGLDRFLADCEAAREVLRQRAGRKARLGIVGHSLGASMAAAYLSRRGGFEAAVLAHPVDRLWDELLAVEKPAFHVVGSWTRRRLRKGKPAVQVPYRVSYSMLFEDKARARFAKEHEPYLRRTVNAGNYDFARTMCGSDWAHRVTVPVLAVWSRNDRTVDASHSQPVFDALGGPVEWLEHVGGHSCFRDLDEDLLLDRSAEFLARQLGGRR